MGDPVEVHFRYFPSPSLLTRTSDSFSPFTSPRRAVLCNLFIWLQLALSNETCQGGYCDFRLCRWPRVPQFRGHSKMATDSGARGAVDAAEAAVGLGCSGGAAGPRH